LLVLRIWRSFAKFACHVHKRHQQNAYEAAAQNAGQHPPERNHLVAPIPLVSQLARERLFRSAGLTPNATLLAARPALNKAFMMS